MSDTVEGFDIQKIGDRFNDIYLDEGGSIYTTISDLTPLKEVDSYTLSKISITKLLFTPISVNFRNDSRGVDLMDINLDNAFKEKKTFYNSLFVN